MKDETKYIEIAFKDNPYLVGEIIEIDRYTAGKVIKVYDYTCWGGLTSLFGIKYKKRGLTKIKLF